MEVTQFIDKFYRHFNARELKKAAQSYKGLVNEGGQFMVTIAGAMSTAELGQSFAEMIRKNKIHAISCTGANLEEDLFNILANENHEIISNYKILRPEDDQAFRDKRLCRVTDTLLSYDIFSKSTQALRKAWKKIEDSGERIFPHEIIQKLYEDKDLMSDAKSLDNSWVYAAAQNNIPIFVPGWEDSTLGNCFSAELYKGNIKKPELLKSGQDYMVELIHWYKKVSAKNKTGFLQIGGGIAGDFAICVVPLIEEDLQEEVNLWSYFCQISDSTTSFGSYSGAPPNEKISWGKLTPKGDAFVIESDATIVIPLLFSYILGQ